MHFTVCSNWADVAPLLTQADLKLIRPSAGGLHHFCPLVRVFGDKACEFTRRDWEYHAAQIRKPLLHFTICKTRVNLRVQFIDDSGRRVPGRSKTKPKACLESGYDSLTAGTFGNPSHGVAVGR